MSTAYQVLARKYRPSTFSDLVGQEAMVRTLSNAIATNRIAHAFLFTGIRGIGKTTTARIIARALNCIGADGNGGPTTEPCGVCEHCVGIREDRHQDVLEMDAASRTGVGDIRELIENVRYLPTTARYKIYIIDEVHMLSTSAFNALLKTLEEPPAHVKFIFATTEIRKIPVTILSRCQRFDLRRLDNDRMQEHLKAVCEKEGFAIEDTALTLIASAAEGSVRDGLSLLDQAIAHSHHETGNSHTIATETVRTMLGLADRTAIFDLFEQIVGAKTEQGLLSLHQMYQAGGDPVMIIEDLLELINTITRFKVVPGLINAAVFSDTERKRGGELAEKLSIPFLARAWQIALKGLQEVQQAPNALIAAEMVLIRLSYVSDLPSPGDLARNIKKEDTLSTTATAPVPSTVAPVAPQPMVSAEIVGPPESFLAMVDLFKHHEPRIYHVLREDVHLVHYEKGKIEFRPSPSAPADLAGRISACLQEWTGIRWAVIISRGEGEPTLHDKEQALQAAEKEALAEHPDVKAILAAFPGAKISAIKPLKEVKQEEESIVQKIQTN